jgi:hypothetical protein
MLGNETFGVIVVSFGLCNGVLKGVSLRWNRGGEFGLDFFMICSWEESCNVFSVVSEWDGRRADGG